MLGLIRLCTLRKLALLGLAAASLGCLGAAAAEAKNSGQSASQLGVRTGPFVVDVLEAREGMQSLRVMCNSKDITEDGDTLYREVTVDEPVSDFPEQGLETVKINIYTGGANCCQGYYLLVSAQEHGTAEESYAAYVEPYDGGLSRNDYPVGYAAIDPAFKGYELENTEIFISRAESPRLNRLLVFADGRWRPDKVGEFPDYYQIMSEATAEAGNMHPLSRAIALSYYSLMRGDGADAALKVLKTDIPDAYNKRKIVAAIFEDIEEAAGNFNPVENLKLK